MGARATSPTVVYPGTRLESARQWLSSWWCSVWGHQVDNHRFRLESPAAGCRECPCGARYLAEDGSFTHVRHTLTCFFGHHTYTKVVDRDGHREYACVDCGHPLLFHADHDPYAESAIFNKKVRYLCGLLGHRVHAVADRDGFREFACHCGHSFLKPEGDETLHITHPAICVWSGHRIRFVTRRAGYAEFVCRDCGHPFCFADAEARG